MDYIKRNRNRKIRRAIISSILYVLSIVLIVFVVLAFVCQKTVILGDSMYPLLENGDEVLIDKVTYDFREPHRYDVIVLKFRYLADTYYVKRIIGLPGETVQIYDGVIYINNTPLDDPYGYEDYIIDPGLAEEPIELGENEYFVLGDNRNVSRDSRDKTVFKVNRNDIIGRAWIRLFPLNKFGFVRHR